MREIEFRGKASEGCTKDGVKGFFAFGYLVKYGGKFYIMEEDSNWDISESGVEIIPETIGQFTGLLDKHGRKIFEGDIVVTCPSPLSISDGCDISKRLVVNSWVFIDMCHSAMCKKSSKREKFYKIVGNIHDNPELLEALK